MRYQQIKSSQQQRRRFIQVLTVYFFSCVLGAVLSGPKSQFILLLAAAGMCGIFWLVFTKQKHRLAIQCFLWLTTFLTSALITINNTVYDPLVICYALILMYAALFSSRRTFVGLLVFISLYCTALLFMILWDYLPEPTPQVRGISVVAMNIFIAITGFTAWYIARDFHTLLRELRHENQQSRLSQQEIKRIATLDPLTGLLNRKNAEQEFYKLASAETQLAVVFIDLDNFKPINDAYGHAYGDLVLKILAQRLTRLLEPGEFCCRFGGDEFVLVLKSQGVQRSDRRYSLFLALIAEEMLIELRTFKISASIGVAHYPDHAVDFNELCRLADLAMYRSKVSGRNTAILYQPEWQDEQRKKSELIQALRFAVQNNELFLHYQPKYHLAKLSINGVEALVRWQSKDFGLVSPATFIPLAEETGLIDDIGLFVLKQACIDCKDWLAKGYDMPVSVNLSAAQLSSGMLPEHVLAILTETQLAPRYLELEITESMLMQDQKAIDSQISTLSKQGINFAIDDFGTGYSNLHYLSRFQAATLKIDQSFVKKLSTSSQHYNLVKGIIVLAKTLGLTTVAEGVEDQNILNILSRLDCDSAQGFLLSKPVQLSALYSLLQEKTAS
ncbi:phosphodiesterase [Rheinheimera sediminis]|uniref:putative bifunctional diguanylate cyclase/phosphodiesterase n=1 Tax=Rheinheimera sp. YQF-1 TaxID=2499626 RepID=UPI000FD9E567|nr:GGDEF domain-containing phosphodiesterase [Rheinheimera sp. YQF-1]RVT41629.1 phosphodiesterase [Rheinheimera sp. YQF-1]